MGRTIEDFASCLSYYLQAFRGRQDSILSHRNNITTFAILMICQASNASRCSDAKNSTLQREFTSVWLHHHTGCSTTTRQHRRRPRWQNERSYPESNRGYRNTRFTGIIHPRSESDVLTATLYNQAASAGRLQIKYINCNTSHLTASNIHAKACQSYCYQIPLVC